MSSRSKRLKEYLDFEKQVVQSAKKLGARVVPPSGPGHRYDFQFILGDKTLLIEVKASARGLPLSIITRAVERLSTLVEEQNVDQGIIVTQNQMHLPEDVEKSRLVQVLDLKGFRNYLTSLLPPGVP